MILKNLPKKDKNKLAFLQSVPTRISNKSHLIDILFEKSLKTNTWNCSLHPLFLKKGYVFVVFLLLSKTQIMS